MRKISVQVVSSKPLSLARSTNIISNFARYDNGSSPTVSIYVQRAAESFNRLVQFHDHHRVKQSKLKKSFNGDGVTALKSEKRSIEGDEAEALISGEKKKKRKKIDGADSIEDKKREKKKKKVKRMEADDS